MKVSIRSWKSPGTRKSRLKPARTWKVLTSSETWRSCLELVWRKERNWEQDPAFREEGMDLHLTQQDGVVGRSDLPLGQLREKPPAGCNSIIGEERRRQQLLIERGNSRQPGRTLGRTLTEGSHHLLLILAEANLRLSWDEPLQSVRWGSREREGAVTGSLSGSCLTGLMTETRTALTW